MPAVPSEAAQQLPAQPSSPSDAASSEARPSGIEGVPPAPPYPVSFEVTGPDRLSRLSTFFRIILAIPLLLFVFLLSGSITAFSFAVGVGGGLISVIMLLHWVMVLVRGRPVSWAWGTIVAMQRFTLRSYSYFFLITDRYPPFDGDWYVQYDVEKPARIRRRQLFFWKTFASIPHFIVLSALWFGVVVCEVVGWFAIMITGRFPRGLRNFVVGWMRWYARVSAYWMSLRDEFPPYSLSATAAPGSRRAQLISAFAGMAVVGLLVVVIVFAVSSAIGTASADVNYTTLTQGQSSQVIDVSNIRVTLLSAKDPYDFPGSLYKPADGKRFVQITAKVENQRIANLSIGESDFQLDGATPLFASLGGHVPPQSLLPGRTGSVVLIFEVPNGTQPRELTYRLPLGLKRAKFVFH
jgi:hypothetical protein